MQKCRCTPAITITSTLGRTRNARCLTSSAAPGVRAPLGWTDDSLYAVAAGGRLSPGGRDLPQQPLLKTRRDDLCGALRSVGSHVVLRAAPDGKLVDHFGSAIHRCANRIFELPRPCERHVAGEGAPFVFRDKLHPEKPEARSRGREQDRNLIEAARVLDSRREIQREYLIAD